VLLCSPVVPTRITLRCLDRSRVSALRVLPVHGGRFVSHQDYKFGEAATAVIGRLLLERGYRRPPEVRRVETDLTGIDGALPRRLQSWPSRAGNLVPREKRARRRCHIGLAHQTLANQEGRDTHAF
jgi:hypothetical protein